MAPQLKQVETKKPRNRRIWIMVCIPRSEDGSRLSIRHRSNGGYRVGQVCNLPPTESPGRLQTRPTLPVTSTPQFLNHAFHPNIFLGITPISQVKMDPSLGLLKEKAGRRVMTPMAK